MAFKTKPGELVFCDICHCSISSKDRVTHQSVCSENNKLTNDISRLDHPIIHEKLLLGKCTILSSKEFQDRINFNITKRVILLHPATMKCSQIYFGRPVVLNRSAVFTAWASPSIPVNAVGIEKDVLRLIKPLNSCDLILVEPYDTTCVEASSMECTLNAEDPSLKKNEQFINYVTKCYVNRYLTSGSIIYVDFYGKECELKIAKISGSDGSEISDELTKFNSEINSEISDNSSITNNESKDAEVDKIAEDLQNQCNVSGDGAPELTSTPAKSRHLNIGYFHGLPPKQMFYAVSHNTKLTFACNETDSTEHTDRGPTFDDFGGYDDQVNRLKEMIHNHLFRSDMIKRKGLYCPQSILLFGPSGSGKTMLATILGKHFPVHFITVTGADVWSKYYGETEAKLRSFFTEAREKAPSILFLDDINVLCSRREMSRSEAERRIISTILTLLDGISSSSSRVFVIAATNKRSELDKALRRPGRLETELEIGVPSVEDRCKILECMLRNTDHTISSESLRDIGERAHGFLGADLSSVCKEAMLRTMQRGVQQGASGEPPSMSLEDLAHGFQMVKPSAMKEVALEIAKVSWDDIGGQEDLKHKLRQSVEWPLKHPDVFTRMGIRPPRGLLMYGPPGCSKTMIAKALAKESGLNFLAIKGPELFSKWVGESERAVRDLFARARTAAPAIIFFDEIDALASSRSSGSGGGTDVSGRVLAQLLTEMDGVESLEDIMVVAATNRPDKIDKALMRPGRLDRIVYVPLPDANTRRSIFKIRFKATPTAGDVDIDELVSRTEKYSGAEVTAVCHEAALAAMQEDINIEHVFRRHFLQALETITPRVTPELMAIYDKYQQQGNR